MIKQGQIYQYTDEDTDLYLVGEIELVESVGAVLINLRTGAVVDFEWKRENLICSSNDMRLVAESFDELIKQKQKPELDHRTVKRFSKYFETIDDDGYVHCDDKFLKCFPSRKTQARDFMLRVFEEVIIPYCKDVVAEKKDD